MILVNYSESVQGACAGGVVITVAAPCITNDRTLLAKSIACSFMALTATKEQLLFGKGGCRSR